MSTRRSRIAPGVVLGLGAGGLLGYSLARASRRGGRLRLPTTGAHVVILGGGFGGLAAASRLVDLAGEQVHISLVDRHNYHLFTPMLYQVATCGVVPYDVAIPLRAFAGARGIVFRKAAVQAIDFERRMVRTGNGAISYDFLVIALGSTTNYFGDTAAEEHASALKSLEDGVAIRNRVIDALEEAATSDDRKEREVLLTFVIIGGGATGVETAGALADAVRHLVATSYPALRGSHPRVILMEAGPKLLGHMNPTMAGAALRELRTAGVDVWLDTAAGRISAGRVETRDGRSVDAGTIVWATGVRAPDVVTRMAGEHGAHGRLRVNEYLQPGAQPNVFAVGDNAAITSHNEAVPLLAAAAMQEGVSAASNIVRTLRGEPLRRFHYTDLGSVVSVGHRVGVAEIAGRVIGGFTGWLVWRVVHLARITSFRNKLATALDWTTGYFYDLDTARLDINLPPRVTSSNPLLPVTSHR